MIIFIDICYHPHAFFKKGRGYCNRLRLSFCLSVMLSPPKPLDEIQPNLVCELNINNVYFDNMVSQIYPSELQLNKANASAVILLPAHPASFAHKFLFQ